MTCPWCGGPAVAPVDGMAVSICWDCYRPAILDRPGGTIVRQATPDEMIHLHDDDRVRRMVGIRIESWTAPPVPKETP